MIEDWSPYAKWDSVRDYTCRFEDDDYWNLPDWPWD